MSYLADESYDVYDERAVRAVKPHRCGACGETIARGQTYMRVNMVHDRTAETVKRCMRCQKLHEHLREKCQEADPGCWPEERLDCGESYESEWGPVPDEIASLAFALPGEVKP